MRPHLLQSIRRLSGDGGRRARGPRNTKSFDWYVRGTERIAGLVGTKRAVDAEEVVVGAKLRKEAVETSSVSEAVEALKNALPPVKEGATRTRIFLELHQAPGATTTAAAVPRREPVVFGRLIFTLADDFLPKTCKNFTNLVERGTLQGTFFHRLVKNTALMGGDVKNTDGTSSVSSFPDEPLLPDENFSIPHSAPGIIAMTNAGIHTNGSQFFISLAPLPHLNGRNVAFGALDHACLPLLERIASTTFTFRQRPTTPLLIGKCGVLDDQDRPASAVTTG